MTESSDKLADQSEFSDPVNGLNPKDTDGVDYSQNLEFRRWFILGVFVLIQITNGGAWATYVGITDPTERYYSASLSDTLWLANVFLVAYLSLSFLGSWLVYKYFASSCIAASVVTAFGGWFRVLAGNNVNYAILAQSLIAIAQIFILETPSLLADRWFHQKERLLATSIGVYSNYAGIGLGYLFSPLIIGNDEGKIPRLLFIEAIIGTVPLVLCVLCVKERPKKPPNYSSTLEKKAFFLSLKALLANRTYLFQMLSFSFFLGNSWTLTTILDSFLDKQIVSQNEVGFIGLVYVFAGTFAGVVASLFLELRPNSKALVDPLIKFSSTLSTVALVTFIILLSYFVNKAEVPWLFVINAVLGIGLIGLTPLACLALVEGSFPVQESVSINVFYFMACLFSFVSSNIATLEAFGSYGLFVLAVIQGIPNIYLLFGFSTQFQKTSHEGRHSSFVGPARKTTELKDMSKETK